MAAKNYSLFALFFLVIVITSTSCKDNNDAGISGDVSGDFGGNSIAWASVDKGAGVGNGTFSTTNGSHGYVISYSAINTLKGTNNNITVNIGRNVYDTAGVNTRQNFFNYFKIGADIYAYDIPPSSVHITSNRVLVTHYDGTNTWSSKDINSASPECYFQITDTTHKNNTLLFTAKFKCKLKNNNGIVKYLTITKFSGIFPCQQ